MNPRSIVRAALRILFFAATFELSIATALAGGGPENVALVVNSESADSLAIANHFIEWRRIPPENVIYIAWKKDRERIDIATFRDEILQPILATIRRRDLAQQIDYVVYSSDFPWSIDASGDQADNKLPPTAAPTASLTGATYLWQLADSKSIGIVGLNTNRYAEPLGPNDVLPDSKAFSANADFRIAGASNERVNYLLSTMLAVTSGRGNTRAESLHYLERSVLADGSKPKGTIYFMKNGNVRSTTRDRIFPPIAAELNKIGITAEIIEGVLPLRKSDVAGAMIGTSDFDWKSSNSVILPGAIVENLTSFGGVLSKNSGQTPLTEFLRHGAAGSSGTVAEPYAIQAKFPLATIQLHYARGLSLAESFYASLAGPYQILIVGDPLCQPWAISPKVTLDGWNADAPLKGEIELKPVVTPASDRKIAKLQLLVDGAMVAQAGEAASLKFDTTKLADGNHEFRIVATDNSALATQGRLILSATVDNHGRKVVVEPTPKEINESETLSIVAFSAGARTLVALQNGRTLAESEGESANFKIPSVQLGAGPVRIVVEARGESTVRSQPIRVRVK